MIEQLIEKGVASCRDAAFEEGVKFFDQALKMAPDHLVALSNRARALSRIDRLEESLSDFEKLVSLQSANAQFMGDYAVALHLNNRNDEAGEMFDKALALEPQNPYRFSSRAFFKDRIGDHEGAIADYDKCIELDPEDAIALNNKGLVEEKLGYKERSKKSFDRSNKIVGYEPKSDENSKGQIANSKKQTAASFQNHIPKTEIPATRWGVIKSVFTKEGFKDFAGFTAGLMTGKKKKD